MGTMRDGRPARSLAPERKDPGDDAIISKRMPGDITRHDYGD